MIQAMTRRCLLLTAAIGGAAPARAQAPTATHDPAQAQEALEALEAKNGGRLGVVALDTASGRRIAYRADERFAMCSTHKFLTAAAILQKVDAGHLSLDQPISFGQADLLEYAPITRKNVGSGFMTVDALCAAAIEWSDNTAANLLLGLIGGPEGWTRFVRSIADQTSRLDRTEPTLNTAIPGDPRDTTTPDAMVRNLNAVLLASVLSEASRARLKGWMFASAVTDTLLRAGLPQGWRIGDKSGSGKHGTRNDVGMILPPDGTPILAAVYYTESTAPFASREKVVADAGRIIAENFSA
jgi:beta-lactamase class A